MADGTEEFAITMRGYDRAQVDQRMEAVRRQLAEARREVAETRNTAEQVVYQTEKLLKDEADKISEETRAAVQADVDAVKEALKGDDVEAVKSSMAKLNETSLKVGQEIYQAQQAAGAAGGEAKSEDDVVDAEIVDEDESK